MGADEVKTLQSFQLHEKVAKNYFDFQYIIGRGGFGKTKKAYAVKELSKLKIIDKKGERCIRMEKEILSLLPKHPFIANMIVTFQDRDYLYFLLDLLSGGDLRYHYLLRKRFTEDQTTCVILGLEHIHKQEILHKDIKPENLVFDENGYLRITDFGIAKKYKKDNHKDTSGTLGYIAPEVLYGENHSYSVDYFSLGVLGHEFMLGRRPFKDKTRNEMREDILLRQPIIDHRNLPPLWSLEAGLFINKAIQRKPRHRFNSLEEMKKHIWFNNYDWNDLFNKTMKSPFRIRKRDNFDRLSCSKDKPIGANTIDRFNKIKEDPSYEMIFMDFSSKIIPEELLNVSNNNHHIFKEKLNLTLKSKKDSALNIDITSNRNSNYIIHFEKKVKYLSSVDKQKSMSCIASIDLKKKKNNFFSKNNNNNNNINAFNNTNNNINVLNNTNKKISSGFPLNRYMWKLSPEKKIFQHKVTQNFSMIIEKDLPFLFNQDNTQKKNNFSAHKTGYIQLFKKRSNLDKKNKTFLNQTTYDNSALFSINNKIS